MDTSSIRFFKAWLLYLISATIVGAIAGAVAGFFLGMILGLLRVDVRNIQLGGMIVGFLAGLPFSFLLFRWAVTNYVLNQMELTPPTTSADETQWS